MDTYISDNLIRFGKSYNENRPLLVKFKTNKDKQVFMQSLSKLKTLDDESELKNVSIINDMTKLEREREKKLVEEGIPKSAAQTQGESIFKVRGPPWDRKVIEVQKKH